jgi:hypothetical protein
MKMHRTPRFAAFCSAGMLLASAGALVTPGTAWAQGGQGSKDSKKAAPASDAKDIIVMRDGRTLEGKILKETPTEIQFQLIMTSGLTAERTIARSEILEVKKGGTPDAPATAPKTNDKPATTTPTKPVTPAATGTKVYFVPLKGEFERDVALTPIRRVMEDAKKVQPDIMVFRVDCEYKMHGEEMPDWAPEPGTFDQLELARQLDPVLTDAVKEDPEWKVKPRMVFWVNKALGGSAFLPFLFPEIYYTSGAKHGGIGYLDYLFEGVGDDVVREKQRSLRLGRAQGLAVKGGHPVEILNAMARVDYILSVNFVGGRPEFHEDPSGEVLLTDDGSLQGGRRDSIDEMLRFTGNDVLTLNADMAQRLGMSAGTVDTENELFEKLGISRTNPTKVGKAAAILEEWSKGVSDAEFSIKRLWREYARVEIREPGGWNERAAARGKRKSILKEALALLEKYKESINPYEIRAMPEQMITQIKLLIDQIEAEQRRDKDK